MDITVVTLCTNEDTYFLCRDLSQNYIKPVYKWTKDTSYVVVNPSNSCRKELSSLNFLHYSRYVAKNTPYKIELTDFNCSRSSVIYEAQSELYDALQVVEIAIDRKKENLKKLKEKCYHLVGKESIEKATKILVQQMEAYKQIEEELRFLYQKRKDLQKQIDY